MGKVGVVVVISFFFSFTGISTKSLSWWVVIMAGHCLLALILRLTCHFCTKMQLNTALYMCRIPGPHHITALCQKFTKYPPPPLLGMPLIFAALNFIAALTAWSTVQHKVLTWSKVMAKLVQSVCAKLIGTVALLLLRFLLRHPVVEIHGFTTAVFR